MTQQGDVVIDSCILDYATKGIFRQLKTVQAETTTDYSFDWLSRLGPLKLRYDREQEAIWFRHIFPNLPADVEVYLGTLLERMRDESLPPHRRIEADKAALTLATEDGHTSLVMHVKGDHHEYAVRRLVNVVNEVHAGLQLSNAAYAAVAFGGLDE